MLSTKCVYKSYFIYMYKQDLALNNLQWLIRHTTKPNQLNQIIFDIYKQDLASNNLRALICHKTVNHQYQTIKPSCLC